MKRDISQTKEEQQGILDRDDARILAKRIFTKLDQENKGYLTKDEVAAWRKGHLEQMNLNDVFSVNNQDVFHVALDYNRDGQVSLSDFENLIFRYLCNIKI
jgi:hypothetical protein